MADPVKQFAYDTPYSLENFEWLMEHSAARSYLGGETVERINDAIAKKNEEYLKSLYPAIFNEYLKEKRIDLNFTLRAGKIMGDFAGNMEKIGTKVRKERRERKTKIEAEESERAEKILKQINQ